MTRAAALALLLTAVAACADDTLRVRVRVSLDRDSCGIMVGAEDSLTLPCEGRVGIWLVEDAGSVLDEACLAIAGVTPVTSLDDLLVGSGIAFGGRLVGERVVLELAVFAGSTTEPCVRPPESPAPEDAPFLSGRSSAVTLGPDVELAVPLACNALDEQCQPALDAGAR